MKNKLVLAILLCITIIFSFTILGISEEKALIFDKLPRKQDKLHDLSGLETFKISQITGEESENKTQSRFNVWGTDLGSFAYLNEKYYMFCGDTFSTENHGNWRSNVLFIIEDGDFSKGLTIVDAVKDRKGNAKELLGSLKIDGVEMTVIPTNIFTANGKLYCIYMSVSKWGTPGKWDCRYSGLAVSIDNGEKWKKLNDIKWPGESNFIQTASLEIDDTMYFWAIPAGRFGGISLMKVPIEEIENFDSYEYFCGLNNEENPIWIKGEEGIICSKTVLDGPVGELSVIYNEYLGNFIITYLDEFRHEIVLREAVLPWGEYGSPYTLATAKSYPSLYGAYMHPNFIEDKGKSFYFAMSQFFPIYNIFWMRTDLP